MASKRNGVAPKVWNKHLTTWLKRKVERAVRASSKKIIRGELK